MEQSGNGAAGETVGVSVSQEEGTSVPRRKGLSSDIKVIIFVGVPCIISGVAFIYYVYKSISDVMFENGKEKLARLKQCEGKHPRECRPLRESLLLREPSLVAGVKPHPDSIFLLMWEYSDGEYLEIRDNIVVKVGKKSELVFPYNDLP